MRDTGLTFEAQYLEFNEVQEDMLDRCRLSIAYLGGELSTTTVVHLGVSVELYTVYRFEEYKPKPDNGVPGTTPSTSLKKRKPKRKVVIQFATVADLCKWTMNSIKLKKEGAFT